jgi:integrase
MTYASVQVRVFPSTYRDSVELMGIAAISQRNAHRSWTHWLKQAEVAHRGIHHMRHAYATMLAEEGVHERVAQYLLGHADSRMTRLIYTHVTGSMMERAGEAVERSAGRMFPAAPAPVGPEEGPGPCADAEDEANGRPASAG